MAREFPIPSYATGVTYPGLTGVTFDYSSDIYSCMEDESLELGTYPDGLLWGGISKNDCPYLYPSKMVFNPDSKTLSITRLNGGTVQSASYPDAQIGYMYSICGTFSTSTVPAFFRTTNWRVDSSLLDWNVYKTITNVGGFNIVQNFANSYICTETPINRTCPVIYALAIHKASYNNLPDQYDASIWWPTSIVQDISIKDIEAGTASYYNQYTDTTYNNLGINDLIIVGFRIEEYGVITGFENSDKIHTFGTTNKNKEWFPVNNLMGLYAMSCHLSTGWKHYSTIQIPSKYMVESNLYENELISQSEERAKINYVYNHENHFIGDFGGYRDNNDYIPGTVVGVGMSYNGDATFDLSDIMDMIETGGTGFNVYINHYSAGDKYVFMSAPVRISGYSNIGYHQLFVFPVFETLDDLYKYIAGYGMAFTIATRSVNERDINDGGIYSNDVFAPILDDNSVYHGEYTRGTLTEITNPENPFFNDPKYDSINNSDFIPSDDPEPEPETDSDIMGESVSPPNLAGIGGTGGFVTHYALTPKQMARLGAKLWAGVGDTDFWDSVAVVLDNTLSINPADILNYIVAVRQYPMKLSDSNACSVTVHTDMYIGRGGYGLEIASSSDPVGYTTLAMMNRPVSLEYGGYLDVPTYYNDFRDYEPCTRITLNVPFCGSCELIPSQVVGKQLIMQYSIDYTSGAITAICNVIGDGLTYPVAKLSGQIGANVQLTASETMDNLQNIAAVGAGIAAFAVNPGEGTALLASQGVATSLSNNRANPYSTGRSGGFSAFFEPRVPYLLILRDKYIKPSDYSHIYGNPVNCMKTLSDLHGYTECENVDVTGLTCTADDAAIIKRLLESGVYID